MKKLNINQRFIILISAITVIVIIGIVVGANVIKTNITNGKYNSSNSGSNNGNLLPEYIKKGITLGGVTGTLESLDTSDATATAADIAWGENMSEIGKTGAVARSKGMYANKEIYGVTSTLIYGVQWDAIMTWIDPNYITSTCDVQNSFVANSEGKGNYTGTIDVCGSSDNYRIKNIYDLAGNIDECTMESASNNSRVDRGGNWINSDQKVPASARVIIPTNEASSTLRF